MRIYFVEAKLRETGEWPQWLVLALDVERAIEATGVRERPDVLMSTLNHFEAVQQAWVLHKPTESSSERSGSDA